MFFLHICKGKPARDLPIQKSPICLFFEKVENFSETQAAEMLKRCNAEMLKC
jgi:hypothetical protein